MKIFWFVIRVALAVTVFSGEMAFFFLMRVGFLDFWTAEGLGFLLGFAYIIITIPIGNNRLSW